MKSKKNFLSTNNFWYISNDLIIYTLHVFITMEKDFLTNSTNVSESSIASPILNKISNKKK